MKFLSISWLFAITLFSQVPAPIIGGKDWTPQQLAPLFWGTASKTNFTDVAGTTPATNGQVVAHFRDYGGAFNNFKTPDGAVLTNIAGTDYLQFSGINIYTNPAMTVHNTNITIIFVGSHATNDGSAHYVIEGEVAATQRQIRLGRDTSTLNVFGTFGEGVSNAFQNLSATKELVDGTVYLQEMTVSGGHWQVGSFIVNGVPEWVWQPTNFGFWWDAVNPFSLIIGAKINQAFSYKGNMLDIIILQRRLTSSERALLLAYYNARGVAGIDHTFRVFNGGASVAFFPYVTENAPSSVIHGGTNSAGRTFVLKTTGAATSYGDIKGGPSFDRARFDVATNGVCKLIAFRPIQGVYESPPGTPLNAWQYRNTTNFDVIAASATITLSSTGRNDVAFTSVSGVREGDYVGIYIPGGTNALAINCYLNGAVDVTGHSWLEGEFSSGTNIAFTNAVANETPCVGIYSASPEIVYVGNSIMAGHGGPSSASPGTYCYNYLQLGATHGHMAASPAFHIRNTYGLNKSYRVIAQGGASWINLHQNPGGGRLGGLEWMVNFYAKETVVLESGSNDVAGGRTWAEIQEDIDAFRQCIAKDVRVMLLGIKPETSETDGQALTRRTYNTNYLNYARTHRWRYVDFDLTIGTNRPSTGFLDDMKPEFDSDGAHLTYPAGVNAWAGVIYTNLIATPWEN